MSTIDAVYIASVLWGPNGDDSAARMAKAELTAKRCGVSWDAVLKLKPEARQDA